MLRSVKLATPATALTISVPENCAPVAPWPMAIAILSVTGAVFPKASRTVTSTDGANVAPATTLVGWTEKDTVAAVPAVMSNGALFPVVSCEALAVST